MEPLYFGLSLYLSMSWPQRFKAGRGAGAPAAAAQDSCRPQIAPPCPRVRVPQRLRRVERCDKIRRRREWLRRHRLTASRLRLAGCPCRLKRPLCRFARQQPGAYACHQRLRGPRALTPSPRPREPPPWRPSCAMLGPHGLLASGAVEWGQIEIIPRRMTQAIWADDSFIPGFQIECGASQRWKVWLRHHSDRQAGLGRTVT
jgi:hypothetical protein